MLNTRARGHPLDISVSVPTRSTQRVGMVNYALLDNSDCFKSTMRVARKTGNFTTVIYTPPVFSGKVLAYMPTSQRLIGTIMAIAFRVKVKVVHTK